MDKPGNAGISRRGFLQWSAVAAGGVTVSGACQRLEGARPSPDAQVQLECWRVRPGGLIPVRGEAPGALALVEVDREGRAVRPLPGRVQGQGEARHVVAPADDRGRELLRVALAWRGEGGRVCLSNAVEVVCTPQQVGG